MEHQLPALPYAKNALAPHISEELLSITTVNTIKLMSLI